MDNINASTSTTETATTPALTTMDAAVALTVAPVVEEKPNTIIFDLDDISILDKSNEGIVREMMTPAGKPSGIFFRILGRDSDAIREVEYKHQNARVKRMAANGGKMDFDAETQDQENIELIAAAVSSWSMGDGEWTNTVRLKGEMLIATRENVLKVFRHIPDFRAQVEAFASKREHFTKG